MFNSVTSFCQSHLFHRKRVKDDMTKIWRKIYEQNYPRSLDHRSFYFKQQEKKNLMAKTMVSEIKDSADRRRGNEQHLKYVCACVCEYVSV